MGSRRVELGFAEEAAAPWRLRSDQFPCKVGGRPAWLGEAGLPGPAELRCGVCEQPLAFLLQLYAPVQDRPDAFHRSLFLFACRRPSCHRLAGPAPGSLRVFRNQLPRKNDIYSYEPPPEQPPVEEVPGVNLQLKCGAKLCRVCGCLAPKKCSRCHNAHYCSKDHQIMDWKAGHKQLCTESEAKHAYGGPIAFISPRRIQIQFLYARTSWSLKKLKNEDIATQTTSVIPDHTFLFPEYEIVIEPEKLDSSDTCETEQEDIGTNEELTFADSTYEPVESLDENLLETMAKHETQDDKSFQKFKKRISLEPEQIIRYCRNGEGPLWISAENIPQETDISNCVCGSKRIFEFQVMPQLLNYLEVDSLTESIDWGTLAIYTCAENCSLDSRYMEEFIWKQDISSCV